MPETGVRLWEFTDLDNTFDRFIDQCQLKPDSTESQLLSLAKRGCAMRNHEPASRTSAEAAGTVRYRLSPQRI
jgi:hypothetical protein